MGSNKVIIDGVNVAGCEHLWKDNSVIDLNFCKINFDNNYFSNGIPCCDKCNKHPNCYFKQLQRAKAEKQDLINYYELREGGMLDEIQHWKNKAQEFYKELEQYKKSKQASYETMQTEWNNAVNTLRDVEAENEN